MTYAFQLARSLGARVYLLHVLPESDMEVVPLQGTRSYTSHGRRSSKPSIPMPRNSSQPWWTTPMRRIWYRNVDWDWPTGQ